MSITSSYSSNGKDKMRANQKKYKWDVKQQLEWKFSLNLRQNS